MPLIANAIIDSERARTADQTASEALALVPHQVEHGRSV